MNKNKTVTPIPARTLVVGDVFAKDGATVLSIGGTFLMYGIPYVRVMTDAGSRNINTAGTQQVIR